MVGEFQEIAHTGGKLTFTRGAINLDGRPSYSVRYEHCRANECRLVALWVSIDGTPICMSPMRGLGEPADSPPTPDSIQVLLASDRTGCFGHHCPRCRGYWRSNSLASVCTYCGLHADGVVFLSVAQRNFVAHVAYLFNEFIDDLTRESVLIDLDAVAEAIGSAVEKPLFYAADVSQQNKFTCKACGEFNDILGRFGYCSSCGTRNDLDEFCDRDVSRIRERLNSDESPEKCLQEGVSAFDSLASKYARQLAALIPMTKRRRDRLEQQSFHDLDEVVNTFSRWFDIDMRHGIRDADFQKITLMFLRRNVYEHNGGEVTQAYLDKSSDNTVRLKQHIREERSEVHELLGNLVKLAMNLHDGFHAIFPPKADLIRNHRSRQKIRQTG